MNYYSIEFFKHYLRKAINAKNNKEDKLLNEVFKTMIEFIKDREENNKSAYSKKWMVKPTFK